MPVSMRLLLSTHADRQGADISFTVCLFFVFVMLRISPARIKPAASNCARWLIVVQSREFPILENFVTPEAPPETQNRTNRRTAASIADRRQSSPLTACARGTSKHALGMCRYTAVPEDESTWFYLGILCSSPAVYSNFMRDYNALTIGRTNHLGILALCATVTL